MKLSHKFIGLGLILFLGVGIIMSLSLVHTQEVQKRLAELTLAEKLTVLAEEIVWLDEVLTQSTRNYIFTADPYWKKRYEKYGTRLDSHIIEAKKLSRDSFEKDLFKKQDKANNALVKAEVKIHQLVEEGNIKAAKEMITSKDYDHWKVIYSETISSFQSYSKKRLVDLNKKTSLEIESFIKKTLFSLFMISLFYFALSLRVFQSLYLSLLSLKRGVDKIKNGDFSYRVKLKTNDEIQQISDSFNHMATHIENLIKDVKNANKAKDIFLANMSHEIRTPLNGMIGVLEFLEDDNLTDAQKEKISTVKSSGELLLEVVSEILDYIKLGQEAIELERIDFDFKEFCIDSVNLMNARASEKNIKIELQGAEGILIKGDMVKLRKILNNLLSNAIKFTENGDIKVWFEAIDEGERYHITLNVKDSGIGIPAEAIKKIFEPFRQADISTTRHFGGTGLGLSISLKLAQIIGGELTCESTVGEGSCFRFKASFPKGKLVTIVQNNDMLPKDFPNMTVLLVEDNLINQKVISMMFKQLKIEFDLVQNGLEAIEKVEEKGSKFYNLILMDLQMPVMDGLEAMNKLKSIFGTELSPVVALTANTFDEDRKNCLDAGMMDFLPKPIKKQNLIRVLVKFS